MDARKAVIMDALNRLLASRHPHGEAEYNLAPGAVMTVTSFDDDGLNVELDVPLIDGRMRLDSGLRIRLAWNQALHPVNLLVEIQEAAPDSWRDYMSA
jgi:hypothetical protein